MVKKAVKEPLTFFKCTRPDGTDFRTGTVDYAKALKTGKPIRIRAEPANGKVCGHGLHVSPAARLTIQFGSRDYRPWRWFEVRVAEADVVESDSNKSRVKALTVVKEITIADIFGPDIAARIDAVRADAALWKSIAWLAPNKAATDAELKRLFQAWHKAISAWVKGKTKLPAKVKVVRDAKSAAAAAADAADAADDADAAAAAADAAAARWRFWLYRRWYVRPESVLRRAARWKLAGMKGASPWEPLAAMFKLGCIPIGYAKGAFVIYAPKKK